MTTPKKKLAPDEAWDALVKMGVDDEAERVLALGTDELNAELRKAGVDPDKVRQRGEELARELARQRLPSPRATSTPSRTGWMTWLAAASFGLLGVTVLLLSGTGIVGQGRPDAGDVERADRLRLDARDACARQRWAACAGSLDEAAKLDPAGDARSEVKAMRRAIEEGRRPAP